MSQTPDATTAAAPLTTSAVARLFNVQVSTVIKWTNQGRLPFFMTPGGQRRFRDEDVQAALALVQVEQSA